MSAFQRHPQVEWVVVASIPGGGTRLGCQVCHASLDAYATTEASRFVANHAAHESSEPTHYGLGDVVTKATSALGLKHCTPCEQRRRLMNQLAPRVWRR